MRRCEYFDLISLFHLNSTPTLLVSVIVVETPIHGGHGQSRRLIRPKISSSAHRVIRYVLWGNGHMPVIARNHGGLVSPLVRVAKVLPWEIHLHSWDFAVPLLGNCPLPLLLSPRLSNCGLGLVS